MPLTKVVQGLNKGVLNLSININKGRLLYNNK